MSKLNVVILAAGLGKRMRSSRPKVLHPLAGKPLLRHVLDTAHALNPQKICVVYGHGGETVPEAIGRDSLIWVKQEPQLGTGHAVMQALPHLDKGGMTLVLYGDVPLTKAETLKQLVAKAQQAHLALLTVELDDPHGYGRIVRTAAGNIVAIIEEKDASPSERLIREVNTGIMALPNEYLHVWLKRLENNNVQKEYYLTDVVAMAVKQGIRVETARPEHAWETLGVNSKAQLAELERIYQAEQAKSLMEQGVTLADPARLDIRGDLRCGIDVFIDVNCIFEGSVQLDDRVRVGAHCILKNARLGEGTQIAPYSLIEDAEVGPECRVGPFARIRPGTRLENEVHIGNFVEVKNSSIGAKSKANHLSYVGDSMVGKNVNIGAGTITCNYDGVNKHRTVIEDDVFIGSDTQLVAPVTVGKGSTIGAGSTITKDTPPGQLTLSRAKQVSIANWKRPVKKVKSRE